MSNGVPYTAPVSRDGGETYDFEIDPGSRAIAVRVSREAVEDYVAKRGLREPATDGERLHYLGLGPIKGIPSTVRM